MPAATLKAAAPFAPNALDVLPVAALLVGADGAVRHANALACELLEAGDPIGRPVQALGSGEGLDALAAAVREGRTAGGRLACTAGRTCDWRSRPTAEGDVVLVLTDVTELVRETRQASRDPLTGLLNRTGFHERLSEQLARPNAAEQPLAVLCIDLDRFKAVNDTLGHPVGDALLVKVAERLKSAAGPGDLLARLGGDEFAVIQTGAPQPASAERLAARLVDLIGRTYVVGGHMLNIGASVGVAFHPDDADDVDALIKRADLALYRAKSDGRGVFRFFEGEMDARMQARRLLEIDLRRALALREFELAFQPQIHIDSKAVIGFEALLRWRNPVRGLVSPAEFIPIVEEIGLIVPIGEWVLRTACREAAAWPEPVSVAVNLSPMQFRSPKLVETVMSALAQSGLAPERLELEITEGALLDDTDAVLAVLNTLRGLGVRISMDDFGTGYSSLSYLQKFPFDKIKIDQSFVRSIDEDDDCAAIVRAVISLGASLGMKTIAEGVETERQLECVRSEGCGEVQGYLTGRPMPAAAAAALFTSRRA